MNIPPELTPALVRERIIAAVSAAGGHLASSLGAVELAFALAKTFDPFRDRVLWDVGHQSYAWKILTGRDFTGGTLRAIDGISGFSNPEESDADAFVSGHAGNAISAAMGMAAARERGHGAGHVVAVTGDASILNGASLEAMTWGAKGAKVIIVLNDNGSSGSDGREILQPGFFDALGIPMMGPVDGHDVAALEKAFSAAKASRGTVLVRVETVKGRGFAPAERDPAGWHGVPPFDSGDDAKPPAQSPEDCSHVFGRAMLELASRDDRVCALTAAMPGGTGLVEFAKAHPTRFFDVGIREGHLVTFAAGLAKAGMRPVVAVYSSFLQRAVDQVMHDVCILGLPVVFAVDRAGCVGADGRTHHGMFDIPMLRCLPNLSILQPRDAASLEEMLAAAVEHGAPVVVRYPRGRLASMAGGAARIEWGRAEQLVGPGAKVQIWALGDMVPTALDTARALSARGIECGVVDARFVKPLDLDLLLRQAAAGCRIVTLENGALAGGFGSAVAEVVPGPVLRFGWPDEFIGQGDVAALRAQYGLDAQAIASKLVLDLKL